MRKEIRFGNQFSVLLLILVLVVGMLAACGDDDKTPIATATDTAKPTTTPTSTTKPPTTAPTPTEVTKSPAGVFRIGISGQGEESHDPLNTRQHTPLLDMIYDSMIGTTWDQMDIGVDGGLATRWEQGADHRSWIIYLRQGMQWDRGYGEITAEDVKFTLDTHLFGKTDNPFRTQQKAMIKDIEVIDPYTVRINTNTAAPELLYMFSRLGWTQTYIACKKAVEEMGIEEHGRNPVGSGPYRLVGHEVGSYFKYEARDNYWGRTPRYKEVYLYTVPEESTRIAMLKRGELDMISDVSIAKAASLKKDGFQLVTQQGIIGSSLVMHNMWEGALAKLEVRQALEMAIDREEIAEFLFEGQATPVSQYSWEMGLTPERSVPMLPYDPQQARELLAQAGYPDGFDLTLVVRPGGNHAILSEAIAGYFEAIGINTTLKPMDMGSWLSAWQAGKLKDTVAAGEAAQDMFPYSNAATVYHPDSSLAVVKDPGIIPFIEARKNVETMEEWAQAAFAYNKYVNQNKYIIFLVEYGFSFVLNPKIDTMGSNGGGKFAFGIAGRQLLLYK